MFPLGSLPTCVLHLDSIALGDIRMSLGPLKSGSSFVLCVCLISVFVAYVRVCLYAADCRQGRWVTKIGTKREREREREKELN